MYCVALIFFASFANYTSFLGPRQLGFVAVQFMGIQSPTTKAF